MSIKALVEGIETARINNGNLGSLFTSSLHNLILEKQAARDRRNAEDEVEIQTLMKLHGSFKAEIEERDRDLVRLMEGEA